MRFAAAFLLASSLSLHAQTDPPGGKPLPWDTISIHVTDPAHAGNGSENDVDNGMSQHAMPIDFLVAGAYTFTVFPTKDGVEGLPEWAHDMKFDIEARVAPEDAPAYKKLSDLSILDTEKAFAAKQYTAQMLMYQALLTERFKLKVHTEMRERNVFLLTAAKGGIRMKAAADTKHGSASFQRGKLSGTGVPMSFIAGLLGMPANGIIIDKTDASDQYDFDLHFTPSDMDPSASAASNDPDFFTAIQEQLGLKLTRGKAQVPVVIVDHIEKPSDN